MISRREFFQAAAAVPALASNAAGAGSVTHPRCERLRDPLGLDEPAPRFSWQLPSGLQSAYQVLVESGGATLWDSGRVASSESLQVPYAGRPLASRQACTWKVRIWDSNGDASDWSEPARFEMGLLAPSDWRAKWIGAPGIEGESGTHTSPAPYFRKTFRLAARPRSARAYVCGLGFHELYLNGDKVGQDVLSPNQTNYDKRRVRRLLYPFDDQSTRRVLYLTHDVTALLRDGENSLGVILGNGWYNQRDRIEEGWLWYGTPKLMLVLEGDDGTLLAATGEDWQVTTAGPILSNGIFTGEHYDARLEMPGWSAPGFDSAAWTSAIAVPAPAAPLRAQLSDPDRVVETLHPTAAPAPNGVYRYDAGRGLSGWARLRVKGPRGRKLTLRFFEEQGSDYSQRDSYVLSGAGLESWEPRFTWHGFRHVELLGATEPPELDIRVVHTAVDRAGRFECSNPLFNQIHETYVRTQLANMHAGVTSDCPHRERLGYTGDGQVAAQSAIYALDMPRFYSKWTRDIADSRNHVTGFVPHTAPFEGGGGGPPWGSAMVLLPWYLYLYYADRAALAEHYDAMKAWVRYLSTRTDPAGVVVKEEPGGWFLGDWCPPEKIHIPPEFVCTCYHAHCADFVSRTAKILGHASEAAEFDRTRARAAAALHARFFDSAKNQYCDGRQGANFFPLAFDLVPPALRRPVVDRAAEILIRDCREHFDTGFVAAPLVLDVLNDHGHAKLAYRLMNQPDFPGFGHMFAKGATTLWEDWDGRASHMHPMFGGACRWFWQGLAGIRPDAESPGFEHFYVQPSIVAGLDWVKAEYRSVRGPIAVHWRRVGAGVQVELTVPGNSTCTLKLPGVEPRRFGPGSWTV